MKIRNSLYIYYKKATMEEIIEEINRLIEDIEVDTSRKNLPKLSIQLIKLSDLYGKEKQTYVRNKVQYNKQSPVIKERIRKESANAKITVAQIETLTDIELADIILAKGEAEENIVYLEPLLKSYSDYITSRKFVYNQNKDFQRFISMDEDSKPF
ncbi:MAG: hypothetical protein V1870_00230 [Candidatus Aenigmatarchaeota archaeon]